ncbi:hypothetical protein HDV05_005340 [Chytridiales sp. JEL 0842]|nr:hypothetical protein HDV05_005340 [Chytridiales sp. JEL 0842]
MALVWQAAHLGDVNSLRRAMEGGADIEFSDQTGCTPLIEASRYGHVDCVRELLDRGANPHHQSSQGRALDFAAHPEIRAMLQQAMVEFMGPTSTTSHKSAPFLSLPYSLKSYGSSNGQNIPTFNSKNHHQHQYQNPQQYAPPGKFLIGGPNGLAVPHGVCKYWARGMPCKYKEQCWFSHPPEERGCLLLEQNNNVAASESLNNSPRMQMNGPLCESFMGNAVHQHKKSTPVLPKKNPISFGMGGMGMVGDASKMGYMNQENSTAGPIMIAANGRPTTSTCRYWQSGTCNRGNACRFSHIGKGGATGFKIGNQTNNNGAKNTFTNPNNIFMTSSSSTSQSPEFFNTDYEDSYTERKQRLTIDTSFRALASHEHSSPSLPSPDSSRSNFFANPSLYNGMSAFEKEQSLLGHSSYAPVDAYKSPISAHPSNTHSSDEEMHDNRPGGLVGAILPLGMDDDDTWPLGSGKLLAGPTKTLLSSSQSYFGGNSSNNLFSTSWPSSSKIML